MNRPETTIEDPTDPRTVALFQLAVAPGQAFQNSSAATVRWGYYLIDAKFTQQVGYQSLTYQVASRGEFIYMGSRQFIAGSVIMAQRSADAWYFVGYV